MRFSVIIPLYNKAPYVSKTIDSVLAQSFRDFELVVVDDGSMDGSAEIADQAIAGREQCRLIRQCNAGVAVARNNGVAASRGAYLCFLDADDWWEPTFLEEMDRLIDEYPEAGIYGTNYTIVNETKHKTRVARIGVEDGFEKGCINYCQAYAKTMYMPLWTGAVCVPRNVFAEMQGFPKDIALGEDFLLWIRIALKYQVAFLNKPLACYNQDVEVEHRGVGRLHSPGHHMLWNMEFLAEEENRNPDCKLLLDSLRTYGLLPYYLSKEYHEAAKKELDKVDWERQPKKAGRLYRQPLVWLRLRRAFLEKGSKVKQALLRERKGL